MQFNYIIELFKIELECSTAEVYQGAFWRMFSTLRMVCMIETLTDLLLSCNYREDIPGSDKITIFCISLREPNDSRTCTRCCVVKSAERFFASTKAMWCRFVG